MKSTGSGTLLRQFNHNLSHVMMMESRIYEAIGQPTGRMRQKCKSFGRQQFLEFECCLSNRLAARLSKRLAAHS
ncbi:hypothetical protein Plhal304r1_c041g0119311 [Plasmopara halstedii]